MQRSKLGLQCNIVCAHMITACLATQPTLASTPTQQATPPSGSTELKRWHTPAVPHHQDRRQHGHNGPTGAAPGGDVDRWHTPVTR
jgi:hypothetical protein